MTPAVSANGTLRVAAHLRGFFGGAAMICALCLPPLAGCEYVERGWQTTDSVIATSQAYKVEALVQAENERQRVRSARCHNPLLTPATISAAANDSRLGKDWINELLRDCPQLATFLPEPTLPRDATVNDRKPVGSVPPVLDPTVGGAAPAEPPA
jgi:hypothetical protein